MTPTFQQYVVKIGPGPAPDSEQAWLRFPNGWGASVLHMQDYDGTHDYWEVMLLRWADDISRTVPDSPLMDNGPRAYLTPDQAFALCQAIAALPDPARWLYFIPVAACAFLWLIPLLLFLPAWLAAVVWLITVTATVSVLLPRVFPKLS